MLIRIIYTLVLALASPLLLFGLYRKKPGKPSFGSRWKEHFGMTPTLSTQSSPIWIHAVSVGETMAAIPLIKEMKKKDPSLPIIVTTTTSTGAEQVAKLGDLVEHRYMPIDFSFAIKRFLKVVKPQKMLIMETELWPNTLHAVSKAKVPIHVLNARLSEKSFQNYHKVQWLFNLLANSITQICCQSSEDAKRFKNLGVSPEKLTTTGSVKFDIHVDQNILDQGKSLRERLGNNRPVWIAASTHKGEDEQIVHAHKHLLETRPDALLVLVPRHPERFEPVFQLCMNAGFQTEKHSHKAPSVSPETSVYIGDVMGQMLTLIGASDVCFMAGSLIGNKVGGHNMLEPAALGVPTITGPSFFNFLEIVNNLKELGGIEIVNTSDELALTLQSLLEKDEQRTQLAKQAKLFVDQNSGAIQKTLEELAL